MTINLEAIRAFSQELSSTDSKKKWMQMLQWVLKTIRDYSCTPRKMHSEKYENNSQHFVLYNMSF